MEAQMLETFEQSLLRCESRWDFFDRFYDRFLASSPAVREKFRNTDFVRQKRVLRASLHLLLRAARNDGGGPDAHLRDLAERHGSGQLDIGAELYDFWLDSLLATVRECDPEFSLEVERAWEAVMMVGIQYLCRNYDRAQRA